MHLGRQVTIEVTSVNGEARSAQVVSSSTTSAQNLTAGVRDVAVFNFAFTDSTSTLVQRNVIEASVFKGRGSTADYFKTATGGTITFNPTFYGPILRKSTAGGCDIFSWARVVEEHARSRGVDLRAFEHVMIVLPLQKRCSWSAVGELPGKYMWLNGLPKGSSFATHEFGHNLGLHHATTSFCVDSKSGRAVPLGKDWQLVDEYGDRYSSMGRQGSSLPNSRQLRFLVLMSVRGS